MEVVREESDSPTLFFHFYRIIFTIVEYNTNSLDSRVNSTEKHFVRGLNTRSIARNELVNASLQTCTRRPLEPAKLLIMPIITNYF